MSWLPLVSDEEAGPEAKGIYDYIRRRWSFVPNYFRALGHDSQLLQDQANLYTNAVFDERGLPRVIKEQLYSSAPVEPKVMELFRFADKLTRSPGEMQQADVDRLREVGWSDAAIFDAVLVTSLYACANRFSAGLGLVADF